MNGRRIGRHITGGPSPTEGDEIAEALRVALASWASGVTLVAVREDRVYALTVTAFMPVSLDPPLVLVSLGPNAAARPFLTPGRSFGISVLGAAQRGMASQYADVFPVGATPFPPEGVPLVEGALAALSCVVAEILPRGEHHLVFARVESVRQGNADPALVRFRHDYHAIG